MKRPGKPCVQCGTITTLGATRCPPCTTKHEQEANTRHNQRNPHHHSHAWQTTRKKALAANYHQCAICGTPEGLQVHHINHVANGTADHLDNLVPLCAHHHSRIEAEYAKGQHGATHQALDKALQLRARAQQ